MTTSFGTLNALPSGIGMGHLHITPDRKLFAYVGPGPSIKIENWMEFLAASDVDNLKKEVVGLKSEVVELKQLVQDLVNTINAKEPAEDVPESKPKIKKKIW